MEKESIPELLDRNGEWTAGRREKIRRIFEQEVYGTSPVYDKETRGKRTDVEWYPGLGYQETVELSVETPQGKYCYPLYIYFPEKATEEKPVSLILYLGNRPRKDYIMKLPENVTKERFWEIMAATAGAFSGSFARGEKPDAVTVKGCDLHRALYLDNWPVKMLLERGYATAAFYTEDLEPDRCTDGKQGILHCFGQDYTWKAIAAWAFGASRALDYLIRDRRVDGSISVVGHSRGGKTALWCAANDPRVTCCYANNSGCAGAALMRGKKGERLLQMNTMFPYWFCDHYKGYNEREEALPIDQHMLLALIAPRYLYLASASEDLWSDPEAEFRAAVEAGAAYRALGKEGLCGATLPMPGHPDQEGRIGYHVRKGEHALTAEDWGLFCNFLEKHMEKG